MADVAKIAMCSEPGCDGDVKARSLCESCYDKTYRKRCSTPRCRATRMRSRFGTLLCVTCYYKEFLPLIPQARRQRFTRRCMRMGLRINKLRQPSSAASSGASSSTQSTAIESDAVSATSESATQNPSFSTDTTSVS